MQVGFDLSVDKGAQQIPLEDWARRLDGCGGRSVPNLLSVYVVLI